jgi:hypothetical protein
VANNPFDTVKFQDLQGTQAVPTTVDTGTSTSPGKLIQAAIPGVSKALDVVEQDLRRKATEEAQSAFQETKAATEVFAEEIIERRDPSSLLGKDKEQVLRASLVRELGTDTALDDPRISRALAEFERLSLAQKDGKLPSQHIKTIALSRMTQMFADTPQFKDEIRAAAKATLNFDPTGADMAESLQILRRAEGTVPTKDPIEEAWFDFREENPGHPFASKKEWLQFEQTKFKDMQTLAIIEQEATEAEFLASRAARALNIKSSQILDETVAAYLNSGGRGINTAVLTAKVSQQMIAERNEVLGWRGSEFLSATDQREIIGLSNDHINSLQKMIEDGSVQTMSTTRQEAVSALARDALFADSEMMMIYSVAGGEKLIDWLGHIAQFADRPKVLNALKNIFPQLAGIESVGHLATLQSKAIQKIARNQQLDATELAAFSLYAKNNIENPSNSTAKKDTEDSRKNLGDTPTFTAFDSNKAVLATVANKDQEEAFNNLYESMATSIPKLQELVEKAGLSITEVSLSDKEGIGRVKKRFDYQGFDIDTSKLTRVQRRSANLGKVTDLLEKINLLMKITARYAPHGLIRSVQTPQDVIDLVLGKEEKETKETTGE